MNQPVTINLDIESFAQCVHHACTDAVETTRSSVGTPAKLPAGVQTRHDYFDASKTGLRLDINRNATTVISNFYGSIRQQRHNNLGAMTGEGFIDRVVDDLPEAVHETPRISGADIHTWALADRVEPLEDAEVLSRVLTRLALLSSCARGSRLGGGGWSGFFGGGRHEGQVTGRRSPGRGYSPSTERVFARNPEKSQ